MSEWRGRGGHWLVFRYEDKRRGRVPKVGDLCIRVADAGDCFHDYVVVRQQDDGTWVKVGRLSAYTSAFGEPLYRLSDRTFHLACAGEPFRMPKRRLPKRAPSGLAYLPYA